MTDGEKMVWAAAFALALREFRDALGSPPHSHQIAAAVAQADMAVNALRSGGGSSNCLVMMQP